MSIHKIKYIALVFLILSFGNVYAGFSPFSGTAWIPHIFGIFTTDGSGNSGLVSFESGFWSIGGIEGSDLVGDFYIETAGLSTFDPGTKIVPPISWNPLDLWTISGTATNINIGTIDFASVLYNPRTQAFTGYAMNEWTGKIPFSFYTTLSQWFEWRVKVLGNIGWNSVFDTFYSAGTKFNVNVINDVLNKVRRNIAILTRNISTEYMNTSFGITPITPLANKLLFINKNNNIQTLKYSDIHWNFHLSTIQSLIIVGGDLIIDWDILNTWTLPKGIIVIKNDKWIGGNIIITNTVKNIESSIFTEGTLYSWNSRNDLYNDTTEKITTLPGTQLYIYWSLISRNTIGGAVQSWNAVCVYNESSCSYQKAIQFDMNYFRSYPSGSGTLRAYPDNRYDDYSLIIERDTRINSNPPPGFDMR